MKLSASILAIVFILVLALLHLQPLFGNNSVAISEDECCASACQKQESCEEKSLPKDEKSCPLQGCNPFIPCAAGSCCYVIENFFPGIKSISANKVKSFVFNDNRLMNQSFEFWQPPEMLS